MFKNQNTGKSNFSASLFKSWFNIYHRVAGLTAFMRGEKMPIGLAETKISR